MNDIRVKNLHWKILCLSGLVCVTSPLLAADVMGVEEKSVVTQEKNNANEVVETKKTLKPKTRAPSAQRSGASVVTLRGGAAFNAYIGNQQNKEIFKIESGNANAGAVGQVTRMASRHFALQDSKLEFQVLKTIDPLKNLAWRFNLAFSGDKSLTTFNKFVKQAYLTIMSNYATIHLGNYAGPADSMAFSGGSVLGDIGLDGLGNVLSFAPAATGTYTSLSLVGDTGEATKITILSPRWKGFSLGAAYTPSTAQIGGAGLDTSGTPQWMGNIPYGVNAVEMGINYIGFIMPELKVSLSVTSILSQIKPEKSTPAPGQSLNRRAISSVAVGGVVNYGMWALGAEYAYAGRSAQLTADRFNVTPSASLAPLNYTARNAQAPRWFNVGLSYIYDSTKFALGYMRSERRTGFADTNGKNIKSRSNIYNASITYQRMPGLDVYVEGFKIDTKNAAALYESKLVAQSLPTGSGQYVGMPSQKANVVVIGMKVSF